MPNWCMTTYHFHGDYNSLVFLHDKITEWIDKNWTGTDFGKDWLGNILYGAGLQDRIDNPDPEKRLCCRGTLVDISDVDKNGTLSLYTETAWVPMGKMWEEVIKVLGLNVGFIFEAEEPGCDLYQIYNPHCYEDFDDEDYYIEAELADGEYFSLYTTEEGAIETLNQILNKSETDINVLIEEANKYTENNDDGYIKVAEFELLSELND